tara:strand:+ start:1163 stop:1411 length:249 start_codon:yes stop_codon:yes gene_type:complete
MNDHQYVIHVWDKIPEDFDDKEDKIQEFESDREITRSSLPEAVKLFESLTDICCKILLRYNDDPYDHRCIPDVLMSEWGEKE